MNIPPAAAKGLSIFLMLGGFLWALAIGWMFLALYGIADPVSPLRAFLYYAAQLVGPIALLIGPLLILRGVNVVIGAVVAVIACLILTVLIGNELTGLLNRDPLQAPAPYLFYALMAAMAVLADLAALLLLRFAFQGTR